MAPHDLPLDCHASSKYLGYGRGRGYPGEWLTWPSLGYGHFVVDARGQVGQSSAGLTPDPERPDDPNRHSYMSLRRATWIQNP